MLLLLAKDSISSCKDDMKMSRPIGDKCTPSLRNKPGVSAVISACFSQRPSRARTEQETDRFTHFLAFSTTDNWRSECQLSLDKMFDNTTVVVGPASNEILRRSFLILFAKTPFLPLLKSCRQSAPLSCLVGIWI